MDEHLGPIAISVVREKLTDAEVKQAQLTSNGLYRMIIRVADVSDVSFV